MTKTKFNNCRRSLVNVASELEYFVLFRHLALSTKILHLPSKLIGENIYLICFGDGDGNLDDPAVDVIGGYYYAGMRRFIWRGKFYSGYDLHIRDIRKRISSLINTTSHPCQIHRLQETLREFVYIASESISVRRQTQVIYEIKQRQIY